MIRSHLSAWANITWALTGPALVAVLGARFAPRPLTLAAHAIGLVAIALITLGVYAWAILGEDYALKRLVGQPSIVGRHSWQPFAFQMRPRSGTRQIAFDTCNASPADKGRLLLVAREPSRK